MIVRNETAPDVSEVFEINEAAFGRPDEAQLVERLRARKAIIHSLVAEQDGELAGHVLFTPMLIQGESGVVTVACGLGPVAVRPDKQKLGIGSALIEAGIDLCRDAGYPLMIVLGHPAYYPRFGFQPAELFDISCAYDVPEDAFMVLELRDGALQSVSGLAHYHAEFDGV